MARLPATRIGKVRYFETHVPTWEARAAEIGVGAPAIEHLAALTLAAREAFQAAQEARATAEAATQAFHRAVAAMNSAGVGVLSTIRVYAESTDNSGVLDVALVSPRAPGSPLPPPGKPSRPTVELLLSGGVRLGWTCKNPPGSEGTIYEVCRRVGAPGTPGAWGPLTFLGTTGRRSFTDETIPRGTTSLIYQITAVRSTARGEPSQLSVNFGVEGAEGVGGGVRIAA